MCTGTPGDMYCLPHHIEGKQKFRKAENLEHNHTVVRGGGWLETGLSHSTAFHAAPPGKGNRVMFLQFGR